MVGKPGQKSAEAGRRAHWPGLRVGATDTGDARFTAMRQLSESDHGAASHSCLIPQHRYTVRSASVVAGGNGCLRRRQVSVLVSATSDAKRAIPISRHLSAMKLPRRRARRMQVPVRGRGTFLGTRFSISNSRASLRPAAQERRFALHTPGSGRPPPHHCQCALPMINTASQGSWADARSAGTLCEPNFGLERASLPAIIDRTASLSAAAAASKICSRDTAALIALVPWHSGFDWLAGISKDG